MYFDMIKMIKTKTTIPSIIENVIRIFFQVGTLGQYPIKLFATQFPYMSLKKSQLDSHPRLQKEAKRRVCMRMYMCMCVLIYSFLFVV